jgi:hydroxymethylpyrimidine pyrophosphatase-like HAD family hydrolase
MTELLPSLQVEWNPDVRLIVSDVDETIADLFVPASPEMAVELNKLLAEDVSLFLVSGAGFASIKSRVVDLIRPELRHKVLVSHCSGSVVVGFDDKGETLPEPYYSMYDKSLTEEQKDKWREIVEQVVAEFHLEPHPNMPVEKFKEQFGDSPLVIMLDDRGPQITFEFVNAYNLTSDQINQLGQHFPNFDISDLRIPVMERLGQLLDEAGVPITPRLGGMFALDLAIKGVSKTTSVQYALENREVLIRMGLEPNITQNPLAVEIWGDKFSVINGGTDRHISEALPKAVRSIDFRQENPEEFLPGYNTVLWLGNQRLQQGLLEHLQTRPSSKLV